MTLIEVMRQHLLLVNVAVDCPREGCSLMVQVPPGQGNEQTHQTGAQRCACGQLWRVC